MQAVANICEKHNINYWLAYGTMLGAVRHKGFIPWDDDIDIYIKDEDLNKFSKYCELELGPSFFLQTPKTDPNMGWLYYKVRKNNTLMLEPGQSIKNTNFHTGIWIDVFPLVSISEKKKAYNNQIRSLKYLQYLRFQKYDYKKGVLFKRIIKYILNTYLRLKEKILWNKIIKKGKKNSEHYVVIGNAFYSNRPESHILKDTFEKNLFDGFDYYDFENMKFRGICDFDRYLRKCYGDDYMILNISPL